MFPFSSDFPLDFVTLVCSQRNDRQVYENEVFEKSKWKRKFRKLELDYKENKR